MSDLGILCSPAAMHIPDGLLSLTVALACWLLAVAGVGLALRRSRGVLGEQQAPLMGVLAACIFAAQMLNFTVIGGTSGHLLGAALAAILLGSWAGMLTMTLVVAVQALVFQDGGLVALGANLLNMAILAPLVAYSLYQGVRILTGERRWGTLAAGLVAAWSSVVVSAAACAVELGFSGAAPIGIALPAMAGIHALIGVGEGLITVGALVLVTRVRPELVSGRKTGATGSLRWVWAGLAVALALALLSPLASPYPDGLERVAEALGFAALARPAPYELVSDYAVPGVSNQALSTIAAGAAGAVLVFGLAVGLAALFRRRRAVEP